MKSKNEENGQYDWTKQWYPVLPMECLNGLDLDKSPLGITILDQDLVIWKTTSTGEYSIFRDKCPHRNTQLSTGKIVNDTLACRYHGWEFNKDGACTKIPMMPRQDNDKNLMSKAFCVDSYVTKERGGLLWVFMDPAEINPPDIPSEIFEYCGDDDGIEQYWDMNINPMSYNSMIENSFDPSHAPFTHEGTMSFSPNRAIPMQYELMTNITKSGFALKHSAYQSFPGAPPPKMDSSRSFIAPVTSLSASAFLNTTIFFVPMKPGEVMTITKFITASSKKKIFKLLEKLPDIVLDYIHFFITLSDFRTRFLLQDRIIMEGQDRLKSESNKWEDMYPTESDVGVRAMQTWSRRFGRPAFTMPSTSKNAERPLSIWDTHAKFCPKCIRSMRSLSKIGDKGDTVSTVALLASLFGIAMSLMFKKFSDALIKASVTSLIVSVGTKYLSMLCNKMVEGVFLNPSQSPKYAMMEIYEK